MNMILGLEACIFVKVWLDIWLDIWLDNTVMDSHLLLHYSVP